MKPQAPPPGNKDTGNGQSQHLKSDEEMNIVVAKELANMADKMHNQTIDLATRAMEARKFLDWHCDHCKESWFNWRDQTDKILEQMRQTRVAIGTESRQLLSECGDVRKFFLSDDHEKEIAKLREFVELCERLRSLKNDGTLDKVADTILKLA